MFPWSHVCKNNNWPGLWMAESTIRLVLNKAWLEWPLGPFSDLSQLPEFIHSLNRYFWGPTTNLAIHNINVPNRWQTRATQFWQNSPTPSRPLCVQNLICQNTQLWLFVFSCSVVQSFLTLWPHGLQHTRPPCPSPSPGACSNSCPLSWWCHPTISSSVVPFSSCLQYFPASGFHTEPHEQYEKHSVVWYKSAERNWTVWKYYTVKYAHGVIALKNLKSNDALCIDSEAFMLTRNIEREKKKKEKKKEKKREKET